MEAGRGLERLSGATGGHNGLGGLVFTFYFSLYLQIGCDLGLIRVSRLVSSQVVFLKHYGDSEKLF